MMKISTTHFLWKSYQTYQHLRCVPHGLTDRTDRRFRPGRNVQSISNHRWNSCNKEGVTTPKSLSISSIFKLPKDIIKWVGWLNDIELSANNQPRIRLGAVTFLVFIS